MRPFFLHVWERSSRAIEEGRRAHSRAGSSSIKAGRGVAVNQGSRRKSPVAVIALVLGVMPSCFVNVHVQHEYKEARASEPSSQVAFLASLKEKIRYISFRTLSFLCDNSQTHFSLGFPVLFTSILDSSFLAL